MIDVAIRRLFRVVNGGTPTSDEANWNGDVLWATPIDLAAVDGGAITSTTRMLTRPGIESGSATVPKGSLVLSTRAPIGYVAATADETAFNQGCRGLVPRVELELRFFQYQLLGRRADLVSCGQGSTFGELSSESLAAFKVRCPQVAEQREIADFLDSETARIDALIEKKRRMAELLRERAVVATQDIVLGRGNGRATAFSGIDSMGEIPRDWRIIRNKVFMREIDERSTEGDEELLTVSHITGVTPRAEKDVSMFMAESLKGYKLVEPHDLVVNTMWAWMGALGVSNCAGIVSPSYAVYRIDTEQVLPRFVDAMFRSPAYVAEITRMSRGVWTSRLRLYPEALLAMKTPVPPLPEQREIVAQLDGYLARLKPAAERLERSVVVLRERRQAVITAAVTEQLRVVRARA